MAAPHASVRSSAKLTLNALLLAALLAACGGGESDRTTPGDTAAANEEGASVVPTASTDEVALATPASGTGNVQGVVLYNGKPAVGIEVTLCEEFNRFGGGCAGKSYTARTDSLGRYVVANVPPKEYAALLAKVFDSDSYVFATSGIGISSEVYTVEADRTLFARPTNLFKSDLQVTSPKAGSKQPASSMTVSWSPYADAAYYTFSLFADSVSVTSPYINYRVDSTTYQLAKPLVPGEYRFEVEAFNASDIKIAEGSDDIRFTAQ